MFTLAGDKKMLGIHSATADEILTSLGFSSAIAGRAGPYGVTEYFTAAAARDGTLRVRSNDDT